ncbi:Anaerobic sulfatase-maturating enzyme [Chlamydia trachomatis]|nr:Anaerobic sulfatase-maturating enzyme [Chlamydia trachomatis]
MMGSLNCAHGINAQRIPISVVAKPTGAACNLDCSYCFFLSKELLYDQHRQQMSEETLDTYVRTFLDANPDGEVTMLWQGGEPTLRGLPFFERAVQLAEKYRRPRQQVRHALQTNATLIDEKWANFLAENDVLVGVSIDGPAHIHDSYRVNRAGRGSHKQVIRGWNWLRDAGVRCNILCTVHHVNERSPLEVYRYFRDDLGADFIQFIPIVERVNRDDLKEAETGWRDTQLLYRQQGSCVTSRSVDPQAYGDFLLKIFQEWIQRDVGSVFVQDFDSALGAFFTGSTVCVHAPECGNNVALEFNGDVYACDHWVEPDWLVANIHSTKLSSVPKTNMMREFAKKKNTYLPQRCRECSVRRLCNGGCPKDRFVGDPGQSGHEQHNYLCEGYYHFYSSIKPDLVAMARLIRAGRFASDIMDPNVRASLRPAGSAGSVNPKNSV